MVTFNKYGGNGGNGQAVLVRPQAGGAGRLPPIFPPGMVLPAPGDDAPEGVKRLTGAGWVRVLYPVHHGVVSQDEDESYVRWELRGSH
jgi:hypothetical protein